MHSHCLDFWLVPQRTESLEEKDIPSLVSGGLWCHPRTRKQKKQKTNTIHRHNNSLYNDWLDSDLGFTVAVLNCRELQGCCCCCCCCSNYYADAMGAWVSKSCLCHWHRQVEQQQQIRWTLCGLFSVKSGKTFPRLVNATIRGRLCRSRSTDKSKWTQHNTVGQM